VNSDVSEIKNRLNIVDVLGEYIRLEKAGANYRALCPFHNEKSPSFMVSEERQSWHCFGCQKGGDVFSFVMEIDGLEFREVLKMLAEKAGVDLKGYDPKKTEEKNRTFEILELATKFYEIQLWQGHGRDKILKYLRDRGLKDQAVKDFRLGYAPPGWRNILTFLTGRGFSVDEIMRAGLIAQKKEVRNSNITDLNTKYYDRFRDRIMFPIADAQGKIVGYSARVSPGGDESQAKYVNTPETEIYHKSRILYGIDKAKGEIRKLDFALLVEGNMDVIAASQAGLKNVVAVSGTALTTEQIQIIKRYCSKIKMFFDMDSAGEAATKKSLKLCLASDMAVEIVSLPHGKDAAELAKDDARKLIESVAESKSAIEHFFKIAVSRFDKNKVEDKKMIANYLLDIVADIPSVIEKNHWIKKIAAEIETSESALTDMLKKANLRERASSVSQENEKDAFISRKKMEILTDEIIGLALSYPDIWKILVRAGSEEAFVSKDNLLNLMIARGEELEFDFESLLKNLENKPHEIRRAERLFFQKKFRPNLENYLEEVGLDDIRKDFEACMREIRKETMREKLSKISNDIRSAEEKKDKLALEFLQKEFQKVSESFASICQ
jgi:DNA primase